MRLSHEKLKEIAQQLDVGLRCFIQKETQEVVAFPGEEDLEDVESAWSDEVEKVRINPEQFVEIEKMDSSESFLVMESFIETIANQSARRRLSTVISGRKPFANFKHHLYDLPEQIRNEWYAFKEMTLIEHVKRQVSVI